MTLTEFLTARLDEDEAVAVAAENAAGGDTGWPNGSALAVDDNRANDGYHDTCVAASPARIMADVDAKRAILALHPTREYHRTNGARNLYALPVIHYCACQDEDGLIVGQEPCETKLALARVYLDRPDFEAFWKA